MAPSDAVDPLGSEKFAHGRDRRPRQDSNLRTRLRRPMLYPLSYEGSIERMLHASGTSAILGLQ